jgi:hypothetical protein
LKRSRKRWSADSLARPLQRALALERQMAGAVDDAYPPTSDHLLDPVAGEG